MTTVQVEAAAERSVVAEVEDGPASDPPSASLGPLACVTCGERVLWIRVDGFWRLRDEDGRKHRHD